MSNVADLELALQRARILQRVPNLTTAVDLLALAEDKIRRLERLVSATTAYAKAVAEEDLGRDDIVAGALDLLDSIRKGT